MQKIIELMPAGEPGAAVGWYLDAVAPVILATTALQALTVNAVDLHVREMPAPPPYAVVTELWFPTLDDYAIASASWRGPNARLASVIAYDVSERVEKDHPRTWPAGSASPGVKAIYLVRRREELSDGEARRRWSSHAGTAREHHVGMSRYVQNGVRRALTADAPVLHGIAMLHFPTVDDLEQRMYGSEEGRRALQRDVEGLVAEAIPLYTTEHILKVST